MTVEDTVTKSSSGQIGGPGLWRVSHKRRTTHSPLPPPPSTTAATAPSLLSLRSGSHYRRGHTVERVGGAWDACQSLLVRVGPLWLTWGKQADKHTNRRTFADSIHSVLSLIQIWPLTLSCWWCHVSTNPSLKLNISHWACHCQTNTCGYIKIKRSLDFCYRLRPGGFSLRAKQFKILDFKIIRLDCKNLQSSVNLLKLNSAPVC